MIDLELYLNKLLKNYSNNTPEIKHINLLFNNNQEEIINDHIAFRTFAHPKLNIDILSKFFKNYDYKESGQYYFKNKKLNAKHFEHPNTSYPKIFISELLYEEFSNNMQNIIINCINNINTNQFVSQNFLISGRHWDIFYRTYNKLLEESEYAAWMYVFGFCPNHFTVFVNKLKKFNTISKVNDLLEDQIS